MRLLIFGLGYAAKRIAALAEAQGARVVGTSRSRRDGTIAFDDRDRVAFELGNATHVLSSVPPEGDDPVLTRHGDALREHPGWVGYLSATGVYGDTGGAWVDETAPTGGGRRTERAAADVAWRAIGARVFRLPGIYGPGRSALDRVRDGRATRIDLPGQVFSRIHVDDIARGVVAGFAAPAGVYNLADDLPASQNDVIAYACRLLGAPLPPLQTLEAARLGPMARDFYAENRRIANGRARRVLGWRPLYPDYRFGLRALNAMTSPIIASAPPATASADQR
ncbi:MULTISPECIES: NAD(P)-dependent oxidoreductase [unclassified Sphingomonas]|uniref:NAD(P)-dependent oxidoreductase n=1 Tax=unclassified Sphingomonas TaxID=196159 RepID=UPI0008320F69|nr:MULTISPECIES: NAD(P)-dependent oxidoreductase [unclassified Sphingomonas]